MSFLFLAQFAAFTIGAGTSSGDEEAKHLALKAESFDKDPGWEGHNNHIVPERLPTVTQDFGYSKTNFAGKAAGELGGQVTRASEPAYYADKIGPVTLDDKLSASGTFAMTKTGPGGGDLLRLLPGRAARRRRAAHRLAGPGPGLRAQRRVGWPCGSSPGRNQSCGTFVTPFLPGKFRPTPIRNDGTRYQWTLDYDPQGAGGRGQFKFTIHGDAPKPGEFSNADIPDSHKEEARLPLSRT